MLFTLEFSAKPQADFEIKESWQNDSVFGQIED